MPKKKGKSDSADSGDEDGSLAVYLLVRTDLGMGKGKIGVQCGHAIENLVVSYGDGYGVGAGGERGQNDGANRVWHRYRKKCGSRKICYGVTESGLWELVDFCREKRIPCSIVEDAGKTQVESGTVTCAAIGPVDAAATKLNVELRGLKLLG